MAEWELSENSKCREGISAKIDTSNRKLWREEENRSPQMRGLSETQAEYRSRWIVFANSESFGLCSCRCHWTVDCSSVNPNTEIPISYCHTQNPKKPYRLALASHACVIWECISVSLSSSKRGLSDSFVLSLFGLFLTSLRLLSSGSFVSLCRGFTLSDTLDSCVESATHDAVLHLPELALCFSIFFVFSSCRRWLCIWGM